MSLLTIILFKKLHSLKQFVRTTVATSQNYKTAKIKKGDII